MSFEDILYNIKFGDYSAAHLSCSAVCMFACAHLRHVAGVMQGS